ncbi:MAG: TraR/DksA C4-type zinc finger protein [Deltaproteobacteria bacterium]|nr:TraR/DksA C4-type zinc finger protein [Deltaproteobacteria bacterium]
MAGTTLTQEQIQRAVDFHGHWCPGLAIGLRASEIALREFGRAGDEEIVAVVECDNCAVDAIQALTGCTFGKGNLIHRDYGKTAFTFYRRSDGKALRLVFDAAQLGRPTETMAALQEKRAAGRLTPAEEEQLAAARADWGRRIMDAEPGEGFLQQPVSTPAPARARIMCSLTCEACGEKTMESRTRRFDGRIVCQPCFERLEARL